MKLEYLPDGTRNKLTLDAEEDPALRYEVVNYRELPVSEVGVTVNFPMELCDGSDVGHTAINGATRQIPVRPWLLLTRTIEAYNMHVRKAWRLLVGDRARMASGHSTATRSQATTKSRVRCPASRRSFACGLLGSRLCRIVERPC